MPTHKRTTQYTTDEGRIASVVETVAGDGSLLYDNDATIAGAAQIEIDLAFPFADVQSVCIVASRAVTVFSNAVNGAGGDTLVIPAGGVLSWNANDIEACPFTIDVTKLYVTNGHATLGILAGGLRIRVLLDVTP